MDISNPRRILAVSLESEAEHLSRLVKDLTGSTPESASTTLAGSSHNLNLKTSYYTATIPIWLDLIASPSDWASSFLSDEAQEVLAVLGGLILVFAMPSGTTESNTTEHDQTRNLIRQVGQVVQKGLGGWEWDGVRLAVGMGDGESDEWDEICAELGLEFVQLGSGHSQERNEFGEKTGILRVREAIESNDWDQLEESQMSDFGDFENAFGKLEDENEADDGDFNPESLEFGVDRSDFEGLRAAIWNVSHNEDKQESINPDEDGGTKAPARAGHPAETETEPEPEAKPGMDGKANNAGKAGSSGADKYDCRDGNTYLDDEDVAKVERLMRKLQAAREIGEGMSETQRKRLAARAVEDVMKEL